MAGTPGLEVIKPFSCSINGILTFISMKNTIYESAPNTTYKSFNARETFIRKHFRFYEQLKFHDEFI